MTTIKICNRKYVIRRIPLRLILNGKPCDARIDYESADILIGDPDGLSRDALLTCAAAAIEAVTRYEWERRRVRRINAWRYKRPPSTGKLAA